MRKKNKYQWPFTKKQETTSSLMPSTPTVSDLAPKSCTWHRSITTLPLYKYKEVAVRGNLSALIIEGFPSQLELQISWDEIQQEFADTMGNSATKLYIMAFRDFKRVEVTLEIIYTLVECLREVYYKPYADRLNKILLTSFKFDYTNPEGYQKELKRCIKRSQGVKIDLDLKRMKLIGLESKNGDQAPVTEEYFQSLMINISDHAKFHVPDSITTFEFVTRVKGYKSYYEQVNAQHAGRK